MRIGFRALFCLVLLAAGHPARAALRIEDRGHDGLRVVVDVPRPITRTVSLDGAPFTEVRLAGFETGSVEGEPELPSAAFLVLVPTDHEPRVRPTTRGPTRSMTLSHPVSHFPYRRAHDGLRTRVLPSPGAYERVYGEVAIERTEMGFAGNAKLARFVVHPVRYDAPARELRWAERFEFEIEFIPLTGRRDRPAVRADIGVARYLVVNPSLRSPLPAVNPKIDLIIADESHREGLQRYVDFKRGFWRELRVHYVSGATAQQVKDIIAREYGTGAAPNGTLLVGSIYQIPAWRGTNDNRWTDFPYQDLDSDAIPDVSVGRVPARNRAELDSFIDKAIARETQPRNVDDVLITAGRDTSLGCPKNVAMVGENFRKASPTTQIIRKFRTEVSTQAVIDAYNDSPNVIVYDGHGNRDGMQEIPLTISSLPKLVNRTFPLILDIACLNANWPATEGARNFAESILFVPGTGAAGILASGGSGDGHSFFRNIGTLMAKTRQNLAADTLMNEVGRVILAAKILGGRQDRTYWNYYGDPGSSVWEPTWWGH